MLDVELPPPQLGRSGDLIVGQIAQPHLADHLGASLPAAPWRRRTYAESRGLDEGRRPVETRSLASIVTRAADSSSRRILRPSAARSRDRQNGRNRRSVVINDNRDRLDLAPVGQRRLNRDRNKSTAR
jgi:hypothetical protein